jgi:hypothetical protein
MPKPVYRPKDPRYEINEETVKTSASSSRSSSSLSYREKLNRRKVLRHDLDQLDLNVKYLERKKSLNEIEKKLLRSMKLVDRAMQTEPIKLPAKQSFSRSVTPKIIFPTPIAMAKIEAFLDENKLRLIDLFKDLDKNKDWKVYKVCSFGFKK